MSKPAGTEPAGEGAAQSPRADCVWCEHVVNGKRAHCPTHGFVPREGAAQEPPPSRVEGWRKRTPEEAAADFDRYEAAEAGAAVKAQEPPPQSAPAELAAVPGWVQIQAGSELQKLIEVVRFAPGQPTGFLHSAFDAEGLLWRWAVKWAKHLATPAPQEPPPAQEREK